MKGGNGTHSSSSSSLSSLLLFFFTAFFAGIDFDFFVFVGDAEVGGSERFLPFVVAGGETAGLVSAPARKRISASSSSILKAICRLLLR